MRLFKVPVYVYELTQEVATRQQQMPLWVEFQIYADDPPDENITYGFTIHAFGHIRRNHIKYLTYEEALTAAVVDVGDEQTESPFLYGDAIFLGLPDGASFDAMESEPDPEQVSRIRKSMAEGTPILNGGYSISPQA